MHKPIIAIDGPAGSGKSTIHLIVNYCFTNATYLVIIVKQLRFCFTMRLGATIIIT